MTNPLKIETEMFEFIEKALSEAKEKLLKEMRRDLSKFIVKLRDDDLISTAEFEHFRDKGHVLP